MRYAWSYFSRALLHRREVGRVDEDRFDLHHRATALVRFVERLAELGIRQEAFPAFPGRLPALMLEDVDEGVLGQRRFGGDGVKDRMHPVLLEDRKLVILEPFEQRRHLAFARCIGADLVDVIWPLSV